MFNFNFSDNVMDDEGNFVYMKYIPFLNPIPVFTSEKVLRNWVVSLKNFGSIRQVACLDITNIHTGIYLLK